MHVLKRLAQFPSRCHITSIVADTACFSLRHNSLCRKFLARWRFLKHEKSNDFISRWQILLHRLPAATKTLFKREHGKFNYNFCQCFNFEKTSVLRNCYEIFWMPVVSPSVHGEFKVFSPLDSTLSTSSLLVVYVTLQQFDVLCSEEKQHRTIR